MEWRKGALFGLTPDEAFFVKCDGETNPSEAIDVGQVTCEIGVAPVKPAEFVIFRLSQFSGGTQPRRRVIPTTRTTHRRGAEPWHLPTSTPPSATPSPPSSTA